MLISSEPLPSIEDFDIWPMQDDTITDSGGSESLPPLSNEPGLTPLTIKLTVNKNNQAVSNSILEGLIPEVNTRGGKRKAGPVRKNTARKGK